MASVTLPSKRTASLISAPSLKLISVPSANTVVLPGPKICKVLPLTLPATATLPPVPCDWITSGTVTAKVDPLPPMATGLEPPEEPITRVGMSLSLLGSSAKPPPAPPSEIATPACGVTCRPVPGAA